MLPDAHRAAADRVVEGRAAAAHELDQLLRAEDLRAGPGLVLDEARERLGGEGQAHDAHALDQRGEVALVGEEVGLDLGRGGGIGQREAHVAAAVRAQLRHAAGHAGRALERRLAHAAAFVARGREQQLQVGARRILVRRHEAVGVRHRRGEQAAPREKVLERFEREARAVRALVQGLRPAHPHRDAQRVVVGEAFADRGQGVLDLDAERLQVRRVAHARELQQLRRVDRAGGEDHLARGAHHAPRAAPVVGHARGALALEDDARHVRALAQCEVRALERGAQVGVGRAPAPAVADQGLVVARAFLRARVVVRVARHAELAERVDEGLAQRVAQARLARLQLLAGAAEVGLHVLPAPAGRAGGDPVLVVLGLAADVQVAVDRARAAEHAPARAGDDAVARARRGLVEVAPAERRVERVRLNPAGTRIQSRRSLPPASSSSTRCRPDALSRLASTQPAAPAPTMT